ncbi:hypothetical protein TA3x_000639 [Tundrisphaera sp. TA3]|uniref:hypothetical protein n=1 Tax=Tundrisphaera sp. TA3 TaxID=3435775 RepID=UPI003EB6F9AC
MLRTGLEWHDSELLAIRQEPWGCLLVVNAVIHKTTGVPGVDPGTVWIQTAEVRLSNGRPHGLPIGPLDPPLDIWDGSLITKGQLLDGLVPCPLHSVGSTTIDLTFNRGDRFVIQADGLTIDLIGEPTYLEEWL